MFKRIFLDPIHSKPIIDPSSVSTTFSPKTQIVQEISEKSEVSEIEPKIRKKAIRKTMR